ncbi:MAG: FliG C-terminal domain-containing protein [Bacteroidota bacterium]
MRTVKFIIVVMLVLNVLMAGAAEVNRQKQLIESEVESRIGNEIRRYYPDLKFLISCDAMLIEEETAVDYKDAKDFALPGVKGFESEKNAGSKVISVERLSVALLVDKRMTLQKRELIQLLDNIAIVSGKLNPSRGDRVRITEMAFPEIEGIPVVIAKPLVDTALPVIRPVVQTAVTGAMTPFEGILSAIVMMLVIAAVVLMRKNKSNLQMFRQEIERVQLQSDERSRTSVKELENKVVNILPESVRPVSSVKDDERLKHSIISAAVGRPEAAAGAVRQMLAVPEDRQRLQPVLSQLGLGLLSVIREHVSKNEYSQLSKMSSDHSLSSQDVIDEAFTYFSNQIQIRQYAITAEEEQSPFAYLKKLSKQQLFLLVKDESPGITAMVLSQLDPALSAEILRSLPERSRADVAMQLSALHRLSIDTFVAVARTLAEKASNIPTIQNVQVQGTDLLMDILDNIDEDAEAAISNTIKTLDLDLYRHLSSHRVSFEDLGTVDDSIIRKIIRVHSAEEVAVALKNAPENIRMKFLDAVPTRSRSLLQDTINSLPQVSATEEQSVRRKFTRHIREDLRNGGRAVLEGGAADPAGRSAAVSELND